MRRNTLGRDFYPFTVDVLITFLGKLQFPQCGRGTHGLLVERFWTNTKVSNAACPRWPHRHGQHL